MSALLCKNGEDWNEWHALSVGADKAAMQAEADRLNAKEYAREHAEWIARGKTGPYPLPLDDPRRRGYSTFFVREVPDWPDVDIDAIEQPENNTTTEIDLTGNPVHILASIAKARGEPIDDAAVQQCAAFCEEDVRTQKFSAFMDALAKLCMAHDVTLSTSGYDGLQVWDADDKSGPIYCPEIEDCTRNKKQG